MGEFGIGQPVPREEDPYLVRGAGRYVDDVQAVGQARAYVLRSPHAHAGIVRIDATEAKAKPGVLLILTGNDAEVLQLGTLRPQMPRKRRDGTPAFTSPQPFLARERVRYLGDPVAFVVAETLEQAKDAAEAITVEYDMLPAVPTTADAIAPNARSVWEGCPDNQAFTHAAGDRAAVAKSLGAAAHVIRHRMVINRLTTNSMEPRGCIAEYAAREARYTLRCTVQGPHMIRRIIATEVFRLAETQFRIVAENVGGGFGMKGGLYPEYVLATLAARLTGRPVKWIAERSEALQSDEHCRDNITDAELGLDADGRFLAFQVRTFCNIGAYYTSDRNAGPPTNNIGVLAGTYVIPAIHVETTAVMTNTMMTGPYRGAGRPEAAYVVETMVDLAARRLGIDPAELRRRNMIPASAMPYRTALIYTYDCGDFGKNLEDCLKLADYAGFAARYREIEGARQAARPRHLLDRRSLERGPDRARRNPLRPHRHRHRLGRHPRPRPGSRHHVSADHRGPTRHRARPHPLQLRRHRPDRDRNRHVRLALHRLGRHRHDHGGGKDRRQGPPHRRPPDGGGRA